MATNEVILLCIHLAAEEISLKTKEVKKRQHLATLAIQYGKHFGVTRDDVYKVLEMKVMDIYL